MTIRLATESDAHEIAELVMLLSSFYTKNPTDEIPLWLNKSFSQQAFISRILDSDYSNFVYVCDGRVVGYISLKSQSHLYHLFVSEAYQRQGIARQLFDRVLSSTAANIITVRSSIYAVPFYKKLGFIESGISATKDGIVFQPMELIRK